MTANRSGDGRWLGLLFGGIVLLNASYLRSRFLLGEASASASASVWGWIALASVGLVAGAAFHLDRRSLFPRRAAIGGFGLGLIGGLLVLRASEAFVSCLVCAASVVHLLWLGFTVVLTLAGLLHGYDAGRHKPSLYGFPYAALVGLLVPFTVELLTLA